MVAGSSLSSIHNGAGLSIGFCRFSISLKIAAACTSFARIKYRTGSHRNDSVCECESGFLYKYRAPQEIEWCPNWRCDDKNDYKIGSCFGVSVCLGCSFASGALGGVGIDASGASYMIGVIVSHHAALALRECSTRQLHRAYRSADRRQRIGMHPPNPWCLRGVAISSAINRRTRFTKPLGDVSESPSWIVSSDDGESA